MAHPYRAYYITFILSLAMCAVRPATAAEGWSLDSCLARAIQGNPELRAADRDLEAARARIRQARALEPPLFSFEAGKLGTSVSADEREQSWRLSQALPLPNQRSKSVTVASLDAEVVALDREATRLRLRGDVIRSYRRFQGDILTLRVLESLQGTTRGIEELTNVRLGTGAARYLDVLRARVERGRLENDLVEARRSLAEHRRTLNLLMARDPDAALEPADSLSFTPLQESLPAILDEARRTRPRVRATLLRSRREEAALSLARSNFLPTPELGVGLDRVPGISAPGFGGSLALTLPFAPWTDRRARVAEGRALAGGAQARHEAAARSLEAAIRTAYEGARAAEAQASLFERMLLRDATDAVQSATRGYQYGQASGTDLFESLRTLRTVQLERIRALLNYELALVDLQTTE